MNTNPLAPSFVNKITKPRKLLLPAAIAVSTALSACATDDPNRRTKIGAGVGAVVGAVIAKQSGSDNVLIGAAIGALAGGAVGNYQDKQQAALEGALEEELLSNEVDVQRLADDVLLVRLNNDASFDINSSQVKPAFYPTLNKIAGETSSYNKTILHVVGYTDSTGTAEYNNVLSQKRANAVAGYLRDGGVIQERLRTEGRGEAEPRLPNTTAANRTSNRRVEIYIKPVVKGDEQRALERPVITR